MKAKIIGFTAEMDCEAITTEGEHIVIDPFVGCSWKFEYREHLLNQWVEDENAWPNREGIWLTNEFSFKIIK